MVTLDLPSLMPFARWSGSSLDAWEVVDDFGPAPLLDEIYKEQDGSLSIIDLSIYTLI
jgi:hypothetical protein